MNIFVAKLDYSIQEDDLRKAFEDFGEVMSVKIIRDKVTSRSKGFGFVEMSVDEEGSSAIEKLNDSDLNGRTIVVKAAKPRENNTRYNSDGNNYNRY